MDSYLHRISGIYVGRAEAERVFDQLLQAGFGRGQLELVNKPRPTKETAPDSDEVRNEVLIDGAIGTAIGAGIGALGEVAIAAANVSLFVASPIIGALAMMGWGAVLGGIVGATAGAGGEDKKIFSDLVRDAVNSGHTVLIVHANSESQTTTAQKIVGDSMQADSANST